jgi:hypothetical protein
MRTAIGFLLLAGLLAGGPLSSHGQDRQYGVTLGVNRVTLQTSEADPGGYFAFAGGVVVRQPVFGPLSVQSELLLNQKGAEIERESGGSIEYGVGYLELPVLLHLKVPALPSVAFHGEAGGFGAVKLFERQTPGENLNISFDTATSFFERYDAGVVAGLGATLSIRERRLNLTVRRSWGLVDIARDVEDQPFSEARFPADGETRTWSLLLRLGF